MFDSVLLSALVQGLVAKCVFTISDNREENRRKKIWVVILFVEAVFLQSVEIRINKEIQQINK